jgi:uncharacterized RDD family membrane protein YckC
MGSADRYSSLANGLGVAPAWRRIVAGLINLTAFIVPLAVTGFGGYKLRRFLGPPLRPLTRRVEGWRDAHDFESDTGKFSLRTRMLGEVVGLTLELDSRNRRSLGARAMRIRRVDALTGGPVTIRSALIRNWAQRATSAGLRPLAKRASKRSAERMQALQPQLKELQRAHADDEAAQQQALMRFYQEHNVNPFGSCAPTLLTLLAPSLAVLFSPRRQSLPDRLAGIVWVTADPGNAGWSLARRGRRGRS